MYYCDLNNRDYKQLATGIMARLFWGDKMTVGLVDLDANAILAAHSHPHEQAGYVLKGEVKFTIGGETKLLKSGDMYLIPGNIEHSVAVGPKPTQIFEIFSPVREDFKY